MVPNLEEPRGTQDISRCYSKLPHSRCCPQVGRTCVGAPRVILLPTPGPSVSQSAVPLDALRAWRPMGAPGLTRVSRHPSPSQFSPLRPSSRTGAASATSAPRTAGWVRRKMGQFILRACSDLDVLAKKKKKKKKSYPNPSYVHRLNCK